MKDEAKKKRAIIILGAGASVEYGIPTTMNLTELIEKDICDDDWMKLNEFYTTYKFIKDELSAYLTSPSSVHYENIYHCIHELLHLSPKVVGGTDRFRPLLRPFLQNNTGIEKRTLRNLERKILGSIFSVISGLCEKPTNSLLPLREFLTSISEKFTTRIYSTNYDDLPIQAIGNHNYFNTGFTPFRDGLSKFDSKNFWKNWDKNSLFHLHGSVHMSFIPESLNRYSKTVEHGELFWFDDRAGAKELADAWITGNRRMDGSGVEISPIVTGLDKLSRIQQSPFCYYYAALAKDLIEADIIFVIGSGLGDIHINNWLHEARRQTEKPPLLFIDYWEEGFRKEHFNTGHKNIEMSLSLLIPNHEQFEYGIQGIEDGWAVSINKNAAVWDKGFMAFLNNQDSARQVLDMLL